MNHSISPNGVIAGSSFRGSQAANLTLNGVSGVRGNQEIDVQLILPGV